MRFSGLQVRDMHGSNNRQLDRWDDDLTSSILILHGDHLKPLIYWPNALVDTLIVQAASRQWRGFELRPPHSAACSSAPRQLFRSLTEFGPGAPPARFPQFIAHTYLITPADDKPPTTWLLPSSYPLKSFWPSCVSIIQNTFFFFSFLFLPHPAHSLDKSTLEQRRSGLEDNILYPSPCPFRGQ